MTEALAMRRLIRRSLIGLGVAAALALVSAAYLRPDMAVTLANQLWNCF